MLLKILLAFFLGMPRFLLAQEDLDTALILQEELNFLTESVKTDTINLKANAPERTKESFKKKSPSDEISLKNSLEEKYFSTP